MANPYQETQRLPLHAGKYLVIASVYRLANSFSVSERHVYAEHAYSGSSSTVGCSGTLTVRPRADLSNRQSTTSYSSSILIAV